MFRSIHIRNFRCFQDFSLGSLERINLIAGKNNVGKTGMLEAIFLHLGPGSPELAVRVNLLRGIEPPDLNIENACGSLFHNFDLDHPIRILSRADDETVREIELSLIESPSKRVILDNGKSHVPFSTESSVSGNGAKELRIQYHDTLGQSSTTTAHLVEENKKTSMTIERDKLVESPPGVFNTTESGFSAKDVERFSKLEELGQESSVVEILRSLEPRLRRLTVLAKGTSPTVYGDIGASRLIPLPLLGEGMTRVFALVLAISVSPNGVVLKDEFENGLHYSVLRLVWKAIAEAARHWDTQIFATTHSFECIRAAHDAMEEAGVYDFRLHRLDRIDGEIRAVSYDREMLTTALVTDLEVR